MAPSGSLSVAANDRSEMDLGEPHWPDWTHEMIERTRNSDDEADWWDLARDAIASGLPKEQMEYLATLGLMELATWSHRIDSEAGYPCAGQRAAHRRHPRIVPKDYRDRRP